MTFIRRFDTLHDLQGPSGAGRERGNVVFDPSHREFFWLLARRDLKVRYAGSTLGGLWNLIHPLMMIAIYMIVFSSIMANRLGAGEGIIDYGNLSYGVHLCAGLIPWLLFSDVLTRSVAVLIENGNFLKKVSFPPIVLFTTLFFNALLVHGVGFLCLLAILRGLGYPVPVGALGGFGFMLLLGVAGLGLGLILSGLNVFFRDTAQVITIAMQLLFWFNPIVYPRNLVVKPDISIDELSALEWLGRHILLFNPLERFITGTQRLFGLVAAPATGLDWAIVVLFPALCLAAGLLLFRRMLPDIRDCL